MAETIFPMLFGDINEAPEFMREIANNHFGGKTDGLFLLCCCLSLPAVVLLRTTGQIGKWLLHELLRYVSSSSCSDRHV
jgi:hypothetical protein